MSSVLQQCGPVCGGALVLEVSPGRFLQDQLIQSEAGDGLFRSPVLALQLCEYLGVINFESAVFMAPGSRSVRSFPVCGSPARETVLSSKLLQLYAAW